MAESRARRWPRGARLSAQARLARESSVRSRSLSTPVAWKAPHVQAPRSRLRWFPAMNWASESQPPARLPAEHGARGAGDGRPSRSAGLAGAWARGSGSARRRQRSVPFGSPCIPVPGSVPRPVSLSASPGPAPRVALCPGRGTWRLRLTGVRALREPPRVASGPTLPHPLAVGERAARGLGTPSLCASQQSPLPYRPPSVPRPGARSPGRPLRAASGPAPRGEAEAPQSRGGEEGGGEGRRAEARGKGGEGEREGRGRPPQFAPPRGSDTQRSRSRRAGPAAAAITSAASEAARAAGSVAAAAAGRPRRAGLDSGCQRRRSSHRRRSGSPTALGWAGLGLGRAQGAGAGARGKTHGRARLSRGAARDCTRTGVSPLRAALGLAPGPGG